MKVCSTPRKKLAKPLSKRKYFLTIAVEKQYILNGLDNLYVLWIQIITKFISHSGAVWCVCISSVVQVAECLQALKHVHVHNTCYKTHKAPQQPSHYSELGCDSDGLQTALSRPRAAVRHIQSPTLGVRQATSLRKILLGREAFHQILSNVNIQNLWTKPLLCHQYSSNRGTNLNLHHSETSDWRSLWSYSLLLSTRRETSLMLRAGLCARNEQQRNALGEARPPVPVPLFVAFSCRRAVKVNSWLLYTLP